MVRTRAIHRRGAGRRRTGPARFGRPVFVGVAALLMLGGGTTAARATLPPGLAGVEFEAIDSNGNNVAHPEWGRAGTNYLRVAPARYADGRSQPVAGPNERFISNRIFNDVNQNVFSDRGLSQWGTTWGQFLDHTFGLRQATGEANNIAFNPNDPLESFTDTLGSIADQRSVPAPGTGVTNPREQIDQESAFIDAEPVYGHDTNRLEWLREGPLDGNMANNGPRLMMTPTGYLPQADARGNATAAPAMDVDGRLRAAPNTRREAGDPRANEVTQLLATQTLFAREHNRIVSLLPGTLSDEEKFQIARRVVAAEQQYITYNEFLPSMGVALPAYSGYNPNVNPGITQEFAAMAYRAHSMNHGEALDADTQVSRYSQATLDSLRAQGVEVNVDGPDLNLVVPLGVGFFNPNLLEQIQLGPALQAIGSESEYRNDPLIDNQLRSVLFQVPVSGNPTCLDGPTLPQCFSGVQDLGAIDIARGRDHGLGSYNQIRQAYGLAPKTSFTSITGEATDQFPSDPLLTPGNEINDPNSIDNVTLLDTTGDTIVPDSDDAEANTKTAIRRTTTAARLRAIYGSVDSVDSFVGMMSEPHTAGTELGELQRAIWTRQFQALRDGDRFFYQNDPALTTIRNLYSIDFRQTLSQVIGTNVPDVAADLPPNVFFAGGREKPASCRVNYTVTSTWPDHFQVNMTIFNTSSTPINRWELRWSFANGQGVELGWNGVFGQDDRKVTVDSASWNGSIPAGGSLDGIGFNGTVSPGTNARPVNLNVNTTMCSSG